MLKRQRLVLIALSVALLAGAGVALWGRSVSHAAASELTLYGNVDIRQIQLAFNDSGRIDSVPVQEGARVHKGQLVAALDPLRLQDGLAQARAAMLAQQNVVARLHAGSRPQEIRQARAALDAAAAGLRNAEATYQRQQTLVGSGFLPRQSLDNSAQALEVARAEVERARQGLSLALQGPRRQDVAAAEAGLDADRARLALAQRQLDDARLVAPADGVIENRILEPGDMAAPQTPVLTLALDNPVWARVYVSESELGRIAPGMRATISSDSFPGQRFAGWVGFVSPTAEFTPKTVQTAELRTELVYRVRVYACNPQGRLRLGMPVTVHIPLHDNAPSAGPEPVCHG